MLYSDKLISWYEKDLLNFQNIKITDDTAIFVAETEQTIEVARVFRVGERLEISIDRQVLKSHGNYENSWRIAKFCMDKYDWV